MAGRPSRNKALGVWMNGERVGTWTTGQSGSDTFSYDPSWLNSPRRRPLSLSLPLEQGEAPFRDERVSSYFENLLPDSETIRKRLAERYGVATRTFTLLEAIGRDCVGAVQLLPEEAPPPDVRTIDATAIGAGSVEALLDQVINTALPLDDQDELRISLAGAQEKTALLWHEDCWCIPHGATPTTHILKLPLGRVGAVQADFSTSVENEWLCSRLLSAFDMEVADCSIAEFGRHKVLVVERFDRRRLDTWWARLPQEDFCQALGCPPGRKYEAHGGPGMAKILDVLRGSQRSEVDRRQFLKAQLLFWLLAAPDGHAKNFSIRLEAGGRFHMTPLYDVMSAWPVLGAGPDLFDPRRLKLAMAVTGKSRHYRLSEIYRRHWNETAKRNALGKDFELTINEVLAAVPGVITKVSAQLPSGFPAKVSDPIFLGIESQAAQLAAMPPA